MPNLWGDVYSQGQLTIHRKTTKQCMWKYWEEMKEWKYAKNEGCGMLFKTIKDMGKHMLYRRGRE